jgi:hypothetical protein
VTNYNCKVNWSNVLHIIFAFVLQFVLHFDKLSHRKLD